LRGCDRWKTFHVYRFAGTLCLAPDAAQVAALTVPTFTYPHGGCREHGHNIYYGVRAVYGGLLGEPSNWAGAAG